MSQETRDCPYCNHRFTSERKKFHIKDLADPNLQRWTRTLQTYSKTNPFTTGIAATLVALQTIGVIQIHICPKCHLPFV